MNDSTNICLACGCCCDGTMIGFVEVDSEEVPRLRELLELEEANEKGFFMQPCKRFCDGCTIYEQRPKRCASFQCGLLIAVEQQEIAFNAAVEIVKVVKQKRIDIEEKLAKLDIELQSKSFYFKMVELKNLFNRTTPESSLLQGHQDLRSDLEQLDQLLSEKFDLSF